MAHFDVPGLVERKGEIIGPSTLAADSASSLKPAAQPRILYLIPNDWYFWTHRLRLARAARAAGYAVTIATLPGEYVERIKAEGFDFEPLQLQRLDATPLTEGRTIANIVALHRRLQPQLVHQVTLRVILYGSIAARLTGVPTVNAVTGLGYLFTSNQWREKIMRRALTLAYRFCLANKNARTIFQNEDDRSFFVQQRILPERRTALIAGAGVDTTLFTPQPEPVGTPVILLTARMLRDKGVVELVEASRLLKQRGQQVRVMLAGMLDPGNPTAIGETELRGWQTEGLVEWVGPRSDVPDLLAQSHIVCLPSYREGLPLSLIEAASSGRPIVTTDVPGCREIVRAGWNGLLVPPKDPVALADALQKLLLAPAMRQEMGAKGRALVLEKFTQELVIRQTLDVYKSLMTAAAPLK
jgi:glycosyltransferase involved in cell wall biosynthesis